MYIIPAICTTCRLLCHSQLVLLAASGKLQAFLQMFEKVICCNFKLMGFTSVQNLLHEYHEGGRLGLYDTYSPSIIHI